MRYPKVAKERPTKVSSFDSKANSNSKQISSTTLKKKYSQNMGIRERIDTGDGK